MPRSFLALVKGLLLVESVALELDPESNFFDGFQAMAAEDELTRELSRVLEDYSELIRRLPDLLRLAQERASGTMKEDVL